MVLARPRFHSFSAKISENRKEKEISNTVGQSWSKLVKNIRYIAATVNPEMKRFHEIKKKIALIICLTTQK
jgi:hypothetical protein